MCSTKNRVRHHSDHGEAKHVNKARCARMQIHNAEQHEQVRNRKCISNLQKEKGKRQIEVRKTFTDEIFFSVENRSGATELVGPILWGWISEFVPRKCAKPNRLEGSHMEPTLTSHAAAALSVSGSDTSNACNPFFRIT
jgi:hypothetical protein